MKLPPEHKNLAFKIEKVNGERELFPICHRHREILSYKDGIFYCEHCDLGDCDLAVDEESMEKYRDMYELYIPSILLMSDKERDGIIKDAWEETIEKAKEIIEEGLGSSEDGK